LAFPTAEAVEEWEEWKPCRKWKEREEGRRLVWEKFVLVLDRS